MGDEVVEFATAVNAIDLKSKLEYSKYHGLFRRRNYFFVALVSNKSGWVLAKNDILSQISNGSISYSKNQAQYKINNYNLKDRYGFTSIEGFLSKIVVQNRSGI